MPISGGNGSGKKRAAVRRAQKVKSPVVARGNRTTASQEIAHGRELAWAGQHAKAIELATQSLASRKLLTTERMDLLDLRAESYIAVGKLDLAADDAAAMGKLAHAEKKPRLMARALNRRALIQMRMGELKAAVTTSKRALKQSQRSKQRPLVAQSLLRLSEAQVRARQGEASVETAHKAIALFQELGDVSGSGQAHWVLASAFVQLNRADESRSAAAAALELCRKGGDQYGIGNALNALTLTESDIAERLVNLQRAGEAFVAAGYIERQLTVLGNLALAYFDLGLYARSCRLQRQAIERQRTMGAKLGLTYALGNVIDAEIALGALETATSDLYEFGTLVRELGDPSMEMQVPVSHGHLAMANGKPELAARQYRSAVAIARETVSRSENIALTFLAGAYLEKGQPVAALRATARATGLHRDQAFALPDGLPSQAIWWRHAQALTANQKSKEAREALVRAYDFLLESIKNIRDIGLRRNALNKVAVNRELLQFWAKDGAKRGLPRERVFAHLSIESNLREPFQRLADTGLRLNALKSVAAIRAFLVEEATELTGGERVLLILERDGRPEVEESLLPRGEDPGKVLRSAVKNLVQARLTRTAQLSQARHSGVTRIVAPLIAQNQVVGYLYADMSTLYGAFDETDRDMLGMLANQGAVALDNAGLLEGLERKVEERTEQLNARVDELAILNSVGEAMAKTLDVKTVTRIVGDKVRDIFHAEAVSIMLLDPRTNLIHVQYEFDQGEGGYIDYIEPFPLGRGLTSKVIASRKPMLLGTLEEQRQHGAYMAPEAIAKGSGVVSQSSLLVPIVVRGRAIGVVMISSYKERAFNENHQNLLQTLSSNMGVAIQNARLFEAEQERVAELQIINSIQQGLAAELDFQAIVDLVGDKLREVFDTPDLGINWYDERANLVHSLYNYEHGKRLQIQPYPPSPGGLTETMKRTRKPVVLSNIDDYASMGGSALPGTDLSKSLISVPIISGDRLIGTIQMENYERENAYGEAELRLLTTIAGSLGTALQNARLFDEVQRLFKSEQQRAAELQIINSVQEGLAKELDFRAVTELVGEKIREIFHSDNMSIRLYDPSTNMLSYPYLVDAGEVQKADPVPLRKGLTARIIQGRETLVINQDLEKRMAEFGSSWVPTTIQEYDRAFAGVPILVGDRAIGAIILGSKQEDAFGDSDVRLLQTLAASLGVSLENARLFKAEQERVAELAIINSIQHGLASKLELQAIVDLVGDKLREILGTEDIGIRLYDDGSDTVHYLYEFEHGERLTIPPAKPSTLFRQMLRAHEPIFGSTDAISSTFGLRVLPGTEQSKSIATVPIVAGGKVTGAIQVESFERVDYFSDSNVRLMQTIAASMGVALENARLFDETQRLLKETEQRNAELAIINTVGQGLVKELDFQAIIDLVGDKITEIFQAPNASIRLYDASTNMVSYPYIMDHGIRDLVEPRLLTDQGFTPHIIHTRQPLVINKDIEARQAEMGSFNIGQDHGFEPSRSFIGVPILGGEDVIGVITLEDARENAFPEASVNLLTTLAANLGVALQNARLFDETNRLLKITEERAEELSIINSVQAGLATQLDIQAIFDLVGDKIRETFDAQAVMIATHDRHTNLMSFPYILEKGRRQAQEPLPMADRGFGQMVMHTRQPLMINEDLVSHAAKVGSLVVGGGSVAMSGMWVPLIIGDEARGVISIQNLDRERAFDDADFRLLQTLAGSLSVAFENARLFNETQRLLKETEQRNAELAIINSVQAALAAELNIQGIYDAVGDTIRGIFHNTDMNIRIYDPQTELVHYPYIFEDGQRLSLEPVALGGGFEGHVIHTRETVVINENVAEEMKRYGSYIIPGTAPSKSVVFVPLIVGDQTRGLINLIDMKREHAFGDSDVRLLQTLANSMSVALENARLFDETQRLLKETEQRAAELAIINSVQQALASKLEIQAIYDLVGDKLRQLFDTQAISLASFDEEKNVRHYYYLFEKGQRFDVPDAPISDMSQLLIRSRETLLINERYAETMAGMGIETRTVPGTQPTKALLRVPILISGRVHGIIGLDNLDHENAFSASDVRLLQTLASSLSVALESARLFEETKRHAAELATVNTVSSALASELDTSALIDLVGEQIRTIFKAEIAYVALLDESGETISFPYQYGEEADPIKYGEGLTSKIIQTGEPLLITQEIDRELHEIGATAVGLAVESYLGVPIRVGSRTAGVVSVQSTSRKQAFDQNDVRLLTTIAANVGSALQNAQLYRDAQESRAAAEQANKAKSTFLANMSHELRTPLNAIIGFTRIVRRKAEGSLPDKQIENLDKVLSSSEHLLSLINTVLDIAKIEAGRMDVIPASFNIEGLADQCATLAMPLLKPGVRLDRNVDAGLGLVYSDQDKIKQIVINLLSNAAKFTDEGAIRLAVRARGDHELDIAVADTGIGISEEALGRVFEEFQQADLSTTRNYGGTGLGLAISRSLARLLGGDLTASSELGVGSTFTLTLPVDYRAKAALSPTAEGASAREADADSRVGDNRKNILVIDDDPDAVYLLQENLGRDEFAVIGTRDGHEGLRVARDRQPDAILLDILMPEVDGWQVLNDLKEDPATREIPVILLTIVDKKALGFRLGAAAYLLKPLDPADVLAELRRVIGGHDQQQKHVLVVDDDPNVAEMLSEALAGSGYELEAAGDGEAGLRAVEARRPDVILLDLMMPKLDGFGVIEHLRNNPNTRSIPVIVISAKELSAAESRMLRDSAAFVMRKQGFDGERLLQELSSVLEGSRAR